MRLKPLIARFQNLLLIMVFINSPAYSGAVVFSAGAQVGQGTQNSQIPPTNTQPVFATPTLQTTSPENIVPVPEPHVPLLLDNRKTLHLDFSIRLNSLYDVRSARQLYEQGTLDRSEDFADISVNNAVVLMPLLTEAPTSRILTKTLTTTLSFAGKPCNDINQLTRVTPDYFYGDDLLQITIPPVTTTNLTWSFAIDVETYSTYVDERALYTLTWPKEYPTVVQDGLKPELFIESNQQIFKDAVTEVMGDELRLTAPYLVAKRLLHYCLKHSQVSGTATRRGVSANGRTVDSLLGVNVRGALYMLRKQGGLGSAPDLVCLCVATLRAAGIPARPVIGLERGGGVKSRINFIVWGEFYLNGCGWIPFDPELMRRSGVASHSIDSQWKGLGSIKELNTRIPLGYHFQPPGRATIPFYPCVWGWLPLPHKTLQVPAILNAKLYTATQRGAQP